MARTELPHGIILPAEYSDDWYDDMTSNLSKLDEVIGSDAEKLSEEDVGAAALSNDYTDLDNKPSIPTKTSDLTNDSNFVDNTDPAVASGITSAKVTSYDSHVADTDIHVTTADKQKWNNGVSQAYVLRYASTSVTPSSTISYSVLNNTDNIKAGDSVIDSAGQVFLIASVDSANQTVTVSAVLLTLALDANVMHLSGDEIASGIKSFIGTRTEFKRSNNDGVVLFNNESFVKGDTPSDTTYLCRKYYGGSTSILTAIGYTSVTVSEQGNRSMIQFYCLANTSGSTSRTTLQLNYDKSLSGNDAQYINVTGSIFPGANNSYSLGNSSNKWKQINGLNPGSLSLPDLDNGIDISGYITAGNTHNEYTPIVDGWISVILKKTSSSGSLAIFLYQGDVGNSYFGNTSLPNESEFCGMASIPVKAGAVVNIDLKGNNTYVYSAKFYPNLGNV